MKILSLILIASLLLACQQKPKGFALKTREDSLLYDHLHDSLMNAVNVQITQKVAFDTAGLSMAPVKVLSAKPYQEEYSSYKGVRLSWKNVSDKNIEAVRFRWYGTNAFGDAADMGSIRDGIGGGYDDDLLRKGSTTSGSWNILSRDLKKIIIAYPTEVAFSDGSKWKLAGN